jgi:non-heme chloroperoxidase
MSTTHSARPHARQAAVSVRGCSLTYREMGDGQPVVFIHGTLASMDTFRRQLLWFAHRARAIAYSRRFHPPSGPEEGGAPYTLDDHAADLIALVEALGITRPHLVGSSYGAYVAVRACLLEPAFASSLVAAEPPMLRLLEPTPEGQAALTTFKERGLDPAREAFGRGDIEKGTRYFFDGIRGEEGAFSSLTNLQRADLLRFGPELRLELTSDYNRYMPPIPLEQMQSLRVPTLLLSGGKSPRLFHIITDALHLAIPGSQLRSIPSADHSIHTSAPAAYNEAVWEFISAHS